MAVWYLDNDDEITDAVGRLRGAEDEHVVFVVPPGSRIATGRLNFKLLAREAESRELQMAIASPDEQVRAMATSAGVLARLTPDEAEAALERGEVATPEPAPAAAPSTSSGGSGLAEAEADGSGFLAWRSQRLRITTLVVLALIIVVAAVARQALPSAEITLTPGISALGPLELTITASTDVAQPDAEAGTIPATVLPIPLVVEDTYAASGIESTEVRATGEVVFSSPSQEFDQEIAAGTRLHTPAGVEFQTAETVTLPVRDDEAVASVLVAVEALAPGTEGNVPAGAISGVPSLESQGIGVTNPEPTRGGRIIEEPLVTAADYDAAAVDLRNRLGGALAAYLRDPASAPEGLTVFAETATLGPLTLEPAADAVVGTAAADFGLMGSVAAQVLAADESEVVTVTRARLEAAVPEGMRLLTDSVAVEHGEGTADGDDITFSGIASASTTPIIDAEALLTEVAGLPVSEAQAILDGLGTATVNVWPGFLGDLPNDRERITLDVTEASATE